MAADKILMLTQAGLDLELNLPVSGGEYSRMKWLVICMGAVLATESAVQSMVEWPEAWEVKIPLGGVKRFDNNTGARLLGHILATQSLPVGKKITGIGVELENGIKYGYTPYYQSIGGLPKPDGLALTLEVILAKSNASVLTINYTPYDTLAMSDTVTNIVLSRLNNITPQTLAEQTLIIVNNALQPKLINETGIESSGIYYINENDYVVMPLSPADGFTVEFIPVGNMTALPASIEFADPVNVEGEIIAPGVHNYNANQKQKYIYKNGVWV